VKKIITLTLLLLIALSPTVQAALIPLGSYQISLSKAVSENNAKNATLAAIILNGAIVLPGETFSYNKTVGNRTIERGFVDGLMFGDGEVINGTGGGVCMTSSILHQAVKAAGLKVIERHNHNHQTSYLPLGEDAAVVYGIEDYKFKNNTIDQVMIEGEIINNNLTLTVNRVLPEKNCRLHIVFNNQPIDVNSRLIYNHGISYLPLRDLAAALGAYVSWDSITSTAWISFNNNTIAFPINKFEITINNNRVKLDFPALIIDGQTMLPVRSTCEAIGLTVTWDPLLGTIQALSPVNQNGNIISEMIIIPQDISI
jgi:hypothetical protein